MHLPFSHHICFQSASAPTSVPLCVLLCFCSLMSSVLLFLPWHSVFYLLMSFHPTLIQFRALLLPPSQPLILFCPFSSSPTSSDPLKWDPIMFFPSCSHHPTMRWSSEPPAGGIKDMIYRAPSQTKKGKRKKVRDQFSSSAVLHFSPGFIPQSLT